MQWELYQMLMFWNCPLIWLVIECTCLEELSNINVLPAVILEFGFVAQGHLRRVYAHRQ